MIIATSGMGNSINYNRIISLSTSNAVVAAESKTYRDTALISTAILRGLYIIEKNNVVSLIWDSSTLKTKIATFNLATLSITYKLSLPIISIM